MTDVHELERQPLLVEWAPSNVYEDQITNKLKLKGADEEVGFVTVQNFPNFVFVRNMFVYPQFRRSGISKILGQKVDEYLLQENKIGLSKNSEKSQPARDRGWIQVPGHQSWFYSIPPDSRIHTPSNQAFDKMIEEADPSYMQQHRTFNNRGNT